MYETVNATGWTGQILVILAPWVVLQKNPCKHIKYVKAVPSKNTHSDPTKVVLKFTTGAV